MSAVVWPLRATALTSAPFDTRYENHLVVAARGGVMERRVAVVVARVDVGAELLDEILHRRQPAVGRVAMRVAGEAFAVLDAGRGVEREGAGTAGRNRRRRVPLLVGGRRRRRRDRRRRRVAALRRRAGPARGGAIVGMFGSAPCVDEQPHRVDVGRVGRAPERGRAEVSASPQLRLPQPL